MEIKPELLALRGHREEDVGGGLPVGAAAPVEVLDLLVRLHPSPRCRLRPGLRCGRGHQITLSSARGGGGGVGEEAAEEGCHREPAARPQRRKHRVEPNPVGLSRSLSLSVSRAVVRFAAVESIWAVHRSGWPSGPYSWNKVGPM